MRDFILGVLRTEQQKKYLPEEWVGKRYGHLTIVGYSQKKFDCICDCGNAHRVKPTHLLAGRVKTCGLSCEFHQEQYDRRSRERLYSVWSGMLARCYNQNAQGYRIYGGRGISVCNEWKNDFWAFNKWGIENGYKPGLSIDRIDGDGNYEPSNCRWATPQEQRDNARNPYTFKERPNWKRTYKAKTYEVFGEQLTMSQIAEKYGKSEPFIRYRMKIGMSIEDAIAKPKYFKEE